MRSRSGTCMCVFLVHALTQSATAALISCRSSKVSKPPRDTNLLSDTDFT